MRKEGDKGYVARACPCERIEQGFDGSGPKCKINGILSVMIDHSGGVGGVWKFRTTSFNSVDGLMGSLAFMAGITGGQLANIPLDLVLIEKIGVLPDGKQQKIYVVGLEFRGTVGELRDEGYRIALENQRANLRIEQIETEARKLLDRASDDAVFPGEEADDLVPEFYPEGEQAVEAPALVDPTVADPTSEKKPRARAAKKKQDEPETPDAGAPQDDKQPPPENTEAPPLTPPVSAAPATDDDLF